MDIHTITFWGYKGSEGYTHVYEILQWTEVGDALISSVIEQGLINPDWSLVSIHGKSVEFAKGTQRGSSRFPNVKKAPYLPVGEWDAVYVLLKKSLMQKYPYLFTKSVPYNIVLPSFNTKAEWDI